MRVVEGQMDQRVTFQQAIQVVDPDGMLIQGWVDRFTLWCHVRYLRGSETVMQARLVSKAPVILTVRTSAESRTITSEWRAAIGTVIFDLKEDPRPSEDGRFMEMLAEG